MSINVIALFRAEILFRLDDISKVVVSALVVCGRIHLLSTTFVVKLVVMRILGSHQDVDTQLCV